MSELTASEQNAKTNAMIPYALFGVGYLTGGLLWIVGLIWAYIKRDDAKGTVFYDHYSNIISVFWWGFLWMMIGAITYIFVIGIFIMFGCLIWTIYRLVKGFLKLNENKAFNS